MTYSQRGLSGRHYPSPYFARAPWYDFQRASYDLLAQGDMISPEYTAATFKMPLGLPRYAYRDASLLSRLPPDACFDDEARRIEMPLR